MDEWCGGKTRQRRMDGHVNDTLDEREEMGTMDAYKSRYNGQDKGTMDAHIKIQWMKETTWMHIHNKYTHING